MLSTCHVSTNRDLALLWESHINQDITLNSRVLEWRKKAVALDLQQSRVVAECKKRRSWPRLCEKSKRKLLVGTVTTESASNATEVALLTYSNGL